MVQVTVIGNDVAQSLKVLKKKMQREGIFREMKLRRCHEKASEKKARRQAEAIRRSSFYKMLFIKTADCCRRFFLVISVFLLISAKI